MTSSIPNDLRSWRTTQRLTLQDVGDLTGLSRSYLSRLEHHQRTPPPLTKVRIARSLGVSVAVLFPPPKSEGGVR